MGIYCIAFCFDFYSFCNIFLFLFSASSAITLDIIRSKLDPINPERYRDVSSFIDDVRLLFENVYLFYRVSFGFKCAKARLMKQFETNPLYFYFLLIKEDSKIYKNAQFLEKFFEEQLVKLLPDYLSKRSSANGSIRSHEAKRMRLNNQRPTEIIDDDDDDVILA